MFSLALVHQMSWQAILMEQEKHRKKHREATGEIPTVVEEKFTVGFDRKLPPMGFVGDDGEFTGFDLDLAAEVAGRLGWNSFCSRLPGCKGYGTIQQNIDYWNGFTINGVRISIPGPNLTCPIIRFCCES